MRRRPQQDSNLRTRLRRPNTSEALTCTDLSFTPAQGGGSGMAPSGRLVCSGLTSAWAFGKDDPRQASADDDAGKCSDGDPSVTTNTTASRGSRCALPDVGGRAWRERRGDALLHRVG